MALSDIDEAKIRLEVAEAKTKNEAEAREFRAKLGTWLSKLEVDGSPLECIPQVMRLLADAMESGRIKDLSIEWMGSNNLKLRYGFKGSFSLKSYEE